MEKKNSFIMKNEKKNLEQKNFDGLLPILWTGHAGAQAGAGRLAGCAGKGAGRWALRHWAGRWALGERRAAGAGRAWARGRALQARGRRAQRQAERAVGWASGSSAQGVRQAGRAATGRAGRAGDGRQARGQAWRGRAGARGWAHGARGARPAWAWPGLWKGGRLGQLGQFWCTVHLAQFWLGFWTRFDSVFS